MMKSSSSYYINILISLLWLAGTFCSGATANRGAVGFDNTRIHSLNIEAKTYYRLALQYSRENKPADAIGAYSRSIQIDPSAAAYNGRSIEYYRTGRYDRAVDDANRAIVMSPRYPVSYVNRGNAYYKLNDYDKALKSYLRAINLDSGNPEYYYNLGLAYNRKGLQDEALKSYVKTVELDPRHYAAWYNRACVFSQKKDHLGAIASLERAITEGFADSERMKQEPALENIRNLPKFKLLLRKIGLGTKPHQ